MLLSLHFCCLESLCYKLIPATVLYVLVFLRLHSLCNPCNPNWYFMGQCTSLTDMIWVGFGVSCKVSFTRSLCSVLPVLSWCDRFSAAFACCVGFLWLVWLSPAVQKKCSVAVWLLCVCVSYVLHSGEQISPRCDKNQLRNSIL